MLNLNNQGSTDEKAIVQKSNQGEWKKSAVYLFFLDFLVLFYQEKSTEENLLRKSQKSIANTISFEQKVNSVL